MNILRDNLFLAALGLLTLVVLAVLGLVLYVAMRNASAKPGSDPKLAKLRFDSLRNSFRQAVELIEGNIAARSERYGIPWVLVLNEGLEPGALPIEQSGVPSALSSEAASAATSQGISWHFFDKGVVVEMQGAYLGSPDDENAAEKPWDEFLGLCHKYRPQRPFDSVVITVPAAMLMDNSADAALELGKMARLAHRRLWLAQNRFAMRFAVYVAVSGCEKLEGFTAFARALPESMRAGMLGWSSPYDLSTTYQEAWVSEAVDGVVRTISDTSAELFASKTTRSDTRSFFLLPNRIESLREQLQLYVDELMRPSAYHEPFFFRGLYFTGDSSQSAQLAEPQLGEADMEPVLDPPDTADLVSQLMQEPAFLRDLFEKKIFLEYGLARPSRQQLARPMLTRVGQISALIVLGGWTAGLIVGTLQLEHRSARLSATLKQIETDARYRTQKLRDGETIAPDWYKARTLTLLGVIEELGSQKMFSVFMPGSWPMWDNLDARVSERVEREFGEIAIGTLRRELYARASELTGVPQDESTSELIIGGECRNPVPASSPTHKPVLAVEDTSEFGAVLQYLSSVERLEQAVEAMQRLQKGGANDANDLRLLVKYTLGAELPSTISQSLRLLRNSDSGSGSPGGVSVMHMQQAVRCSLVKGMSTLDQRVFVNNDLLVMERQLAALSYRLLSTDFRSTGYAQTVAGYKDILSIIREEEGMLATGRGAWMHEPSFDLGKAYAAALDRVAQMTRLLGPEAAEKVRQHAVAEYLKFASEFSARAHPETGDIAWQEKDARFGLSPQRLGLRDAITGLLGQPFMTPPGDREIPEIPAQGVLLWDSTKLDQALALGDLHKRFLAEGLLKFPATNRPGVVAFLNGQFARLINDKLIDALAVSGRVDPANVSDANAFDAARGRLVKVEALLDELGALSAADTLRRLVSADAGVRLRQIDKSLNQSDLYAIRGRDFSYWSGDKGPLLQAFGVPDVQALQQYLLLQFNRADALGKQAEIYLPSLDKVSTDSQLVNRWQAINRELERYRGKNPNSSLGLYEQFLLTAGADMDRSNCADKLIGKTPGNRPADYFAERHAQVYNALFRRCVELRSSEQMEQWNSLAGLFNSQLAGRAPFAIPGAKDTLDADYDDLSQLFKGSEKMARLLKDPVVAGGRNSTPSAAARRFSDQIERVRTFMAPLYPVEDGMVAGYDVAVEFRANQAGEMEGNKVIDWSLDVGPQTIKLRDTPRLLRWEPGMPLTLTLRLAKDIPGNALADPQQSAMSVDGKTVSYRYTDTWSLIRMVQRQREADPSGRGDLRTQLLRMEFPIGTGTEAGKGAQPDTRAKVYLRLTLYPVGKRTPMAWPVTFPIRAPEFTGP